MTEAAGSGGVRNQVGGIAGILSALCFLGSALTTGVIVSHQGAYGWFGMVGTILAMLFAWALYYRAVGEANRQTLQLAAILFVLGGIFYSWLYLGALLSHALTPLVGEAGQLAELWKALSGQLSVVSIVTGTVYFVGVLLFAADGLRRGPGPRWADWLGVVGAVLAMLWFGIGFLPEILGLVAVLGFMLTWVWMIAHGVQMLRGA